MTAAPVTVRLDPRRLEQLKAIAAANRSTIASVIASLIREKIAAGIIPPTIPGMSVTKSAAGVAIELSAGHSKVFAPDNARRIARRIREVVNGTDVPGVDLDLGFSVLRQGTGFKIALPFPGPEIVFPGDLAVDLADLIEKVAE